MYSKTKLERVLELHRGYDLPERERKEGNVPIISSSGYSGLHNDCKCDGENVITGRYGTIGEVFYHEGKCWPLNTALYVSDFKENNPKYVYYLLKYILKMSIDGKDKSTVPGVDRNVLHQMEIPFCQDIKEQKELIRILEKLDERIDLNRKINDNLLDSVQAIFRSWFVDYDPFDGVCPSNWETGCVEDIAEFFDSMRKPLSSLERTDMERIYPYYGAVSIVDYVDDYIFDGEYLLVSEDGIYVVDENGHPLIQHISGKFWANNHAHILKGKSGFNEDSLYLFLANTNMAPIVTGAAQPKINQANLKSFPITIPDSETMLKFNNIIQPFFDQRLTNESEIKKLEALQSLLLTRLVD